MTSPKPVAACFVSLSAHSILAPDVHFTFGGMETRAWMLARGLASHDDIRLSFVVGDYGQPLREIRDRVEVIRKTDTVRRVRNLVKRAVNFSPTFPWITIVHWHWSLLWQIPAYVGHYLAKRLRSHPFSNSDPFPPNPDPFFVALPADVFCCFGVNPVSAAVVASARATNRRAVLFIASDSDLDSRYAPHSACLNAYHQPVHVCHFALAHADRIIVQTEHQQQLLRDRFNRDSVVISNPVELPDTSTTTGKEYALWIGRCENFHKRADLFIMLASQCPDVPFLMIMNRQDPRLDNQIHRDRPANVRIVDSVPFQEMSGVYRRAGLLVSTSSSVQEGFPNVFLQAAAHGIPIASLEVDPTSMIKRTGCGLVADGNLALLSRQVQQLWNDRDFAVRCGTLGREYVQQHHRLEDKVQQLADVLQTLCRP